MSKKGRYRAILFDLDGTLTDPEEGITRSFQYALRHFGIEEQDPEKLRRVIGPPLLNSFIEYYGFSQIDALLAIDYYREYFSKTGIYENRVYPGIPQMLQQLKQAGKSIILATSKPHVYARQILEHFSLDSYVDFVSGSELDGTRNAKSEVIAYALQQTGFQVSETVMVGDRRHDVEGAIANGMDVIAVLFGYGTREELADAGATVFAQSPQQLTELILG